MQEILKPVLLRFARGFVAGAIASLGTISLTTVGTWHDLSSALTALAYSLAVGGITGGLMALDKYLRFQPEDSSPAN